MSKIESGIIMLNSKKYKIGIISYYNLNNLDNGGKIRNHNLATELTNLGNFVYLIMPEDLEYKRKNKNYNIQEVKLPYKNHLSKILNLTRFGYHYFKKRKVDFIIAEHAWSLPIGFLLSKLLKVPLILDDHNIEYLRAKLMKKYIRFCYAFLLEKLLARSCSLITLVSKNEKQYFEQFVKSNETLIVVPNGTSIIPNSDKLSKYSLYNKQIKKKYDIKSNKTLALFIGDLSYNPNQEAVRILSEKSKEISDKVQILVIGKNSDTINFSLNNLIITGYVNNLNIYLFGCDIAIQPLLSGGGTNLKVIEALTVGLPILCTSYALRGIDLMKTNQVLISEDFNDYPNILSEFHNKQKNIRFDRKIDTTRHWKHSLNTLIDYLSKNDL